MDWVITTAAVFAAWVAVSLIGYERQRRLDELAAQTAPEPHVEPHAA